MSKIIKLDLSRYIQYFIMIILVCNISVLNARSFHIENDSIKKSISNIPFEEVDVPPVFSGCSKWKEDCEQRNCFDRSIIKSIKNYIEKGLESEGLDVSVSLRATIEFVIDSVGSIREINVTGQDQILNNYSKEGLLRLSKTPRILPGKHQGKPVDVLYSIKIKAESYEQVKDGSLVVQRDYGEDFENNKFSRLVIHPHCRETGKSEKDKKCLSEKVKKYVNKKFNTKIANDLGLSGLNRIYVRFAISKCGNIVGVEARGPHPALEREAVRVVESLPKMKPAQIKNENVNVMYSLPIDFQVQD